MNRRFRASISGWPAFLGLMMACLLACPWSVSGAMAAETHRSDYDLWISVSHQAVERSINLLNPAANRNNKAPELVVLTNAGYAAAKDRSTEACLDGLRENAHVSEGKRTLLSIHAAAGDPLWFFMMDKENGNGVYSEIDPDALDFTDFSIRGELFAIRSLRNVKADNLFADPETAHKTLFTDNAFNGNEFRIIGLSNLLLENAPYDLIRSVQYHDHYCPGVTSGYFLVRYLKKHFPLTDEYGSYFVLSIPPYCKDDALITLLNATPGKRGYGVFYLTAEDKAMLKDGAQNIAGVFFRWNGDAGAPEGEGTILSFDFTEVRAANNWGEKTAWNWWESRLKMNLWCLGQLDHPERFISEIPFNGEPTFNLTDISGIAQPRELVRPGSDPLVILGLRDMKGDKE